MREGMKINDKYLRDFRVPVYSVTTRIEMQTVSTGYANML